MKTALWDKILPDWKKSLKNGLKMRLVNGLKNPKKRM